MFKNNVTKNPKFTDLVRSKITTHFEEYGISNDLFMVATILLSKRVENPKIQSYIYYCTTSDELVDVPWTTSDDNSSYTFNWFVTPLENVDSHFSDGTGLQAIEKFVLTSINKNVKVRLYTKQNTVCIFVEKLSMDLWHFMISFMSLYFDIFKEKPLSEKEKKFMRTLSLKTSTNYESMLNEMVEEAEFKEFLMKIQLSGLEKRFYQARISSAEKKIKDYEAAMNEMLKRYRDAYEDYQKEQYNLNGLMLAAQNETAGLEEYLLNNKNLVNIVIDGDYIKFVVKTYLYPYMHDVWENLDKNGSIYRNIFANIPKKDLQLLLNAIFSENHSLKLKMCAFFQINYFGSTCSSMRGYDFQKVDSDLVNYVPNTHLNKHNCFGQNMPDILNCLKDGDIVSAIECCINCTKRINVCETMTFNPFISSLLENKGKCLVTEDGKELTVTEAIKYLKGLYNENVEQAQAEIEDILYN